MRSGLHLIKKAFGPGLYWAYSFCDLYKRYGLQQTLGYVRTLRRSQKAAEVQSAQHYRKMSLSDVQKSRKSDLVFIFGSGYSLNGISLSEWAHFAAHDIVGFNAFVHQKWVRVDFHLVRGWGEGASVFADLKALTGEFQSLIDRNSLYADTTYVYQDDLTAHFAHALFEYNALPKGAKVFPYRTNYLDVLPSLDMRRGLLHNVSTLCDAVHFAYAMGWKKIVLVGVDLYDTRYFWLKPDETFALDYKTGKRTVSQTSDRGQRFDQAHSTIRNGVVDTFDSWNKHFLQHGVSLSVYNRHSLLTEVLPVYERTAT